MADLYDNYAELAAAEAEGVDYSRATTTVSGASWSSIAIHGGGIEVGSEEIAVSVAAGIANCYIFAGLKSSGNADLHITSTNFDEPVGVALVTASRHTLSFHGFVGDTDVATTAIGGLDLAMVEKLTTRLQRAGFLVEPAPEEIAGAEPGNICNRNLSGMGVQLELSRAQRQAFFPGGVTTRVMRESGQRTDAFWAYAAVMRSVIPTPRPNSGITSRPGSGATSRPYAGTTPRP